MSTRQKVQKVTMPTHFHLYDFLCRYNSKSHVKCFIAFNVALQVTLIGLTMARAIYDGMMWSYLVFVINLINFVVISIDARFFGFGNAISLFFILSSESIALGANIMVRPCTHACMDGKGTIPLTHPHCRYALLGNGSCVLPLCLSSCSGSYRKVALLPISSAPCSGPYTAFGTSYKTCPS